MDARTDATSGIRLAELLVGLSSVADLGMGQPMGTAVRTCQVAVRLAEAMACDNKTISDVFYAALLQYGGCTAYSYEASALVTDEVAARRAALTADFDRPRAALFGYAPPLVPDSRPWWKLRAAATGVLRFRSLSRRYSQASSEVAAVVARRLELSDGVQRALRDVFERWDAKGNPRGCGGEGISLVARIVKVASCAVLFDRVGGEAAAANALRQRQGRLLDPEAVSTFLTSVGLLLRGPDVVTSDQVLRLEPNPAMVGATDPVDEALRVFGDTVDLKAPFFHGGSAGVARLTRDACSRLQLDDDERVAAVRAAYVHDLGRVAVPSSIWLSKVELGSDAWAQIHVHARYSEQILARVPSLERVATLAGLHHERIDGSGYHRGVSREQLPVAAQVLAAADAYQALTSTRPFRPARSAARAASELGAMGRSGELDPDVVNAVLGATDHVSEVQNAFPDGLTRRQLEVLRLATSGRSHKAIATRLDVAPGEAEQEIQVVYEQIGVRSRAAAAMYAMEHGLL